MATLIDPARGIYSASLYGKRAALCGAAAERAARKFFVTTAKYRVAHGDDIVWLCDDNSCSLTNADTPDELRVDWTSDGYLSALLEGQFAADGKDAEKIEKFLDQIAAAPAKAHCP
ncbi:MAG: hypothetical protein ACTHU0_07185 [Kofleriaceae bacterium]